MGRLVETLNPDRLLQRGYVRVEAKSGGTITSAAAARAAGALVLRFGDGPLDVTTERAKVERAPAAAYSSKPEQPRLL